MSRDTDSPSSDPRGPGDPQRREADAAAPGAPQPGEKKTETAMTTRIRINIPGSRPIPPVVMRETVDSGDGTAPPAGEARAAAAHDADGGKKTSSWFEPRKPPRDEDAGDTPAGGVPGAAGVPGTSGTAPGPYDTPAGGIPAARSPHETPPDGTPAPGSPPGHGSPSSGGPGGVPYDTPAGGVPSAGRPGGHPQEPGDEWFREAPGASTPPGGVPGFSSPAPGGTGSGTGLPPRPVGPTSGPGTGAMPLTPAPGAPAPPPARPEETEPGGTTMDLGGPFPPAPPRKHTDAGPGAPLSAPFAPRPGAPPPAAPGEPEPAAPEPDDPPRGAGRRRGRKALKLLVTAVLGVAALAYGAGLLLNPEDVPVGTTVLGVDIGGISSQEAQERLDEALDTANNTPLTLLLGENTEEVELKPSVAGLAVDTEATVHSVSGKDYHPVAVIGSLFGMARPEEAVFDVDHEKLAVALDDIAAGVGAGPVEGRITFGSDGPTAHPGRPGQAVDIESAADAVESAFRERAATARNPAIGLPVTAQEPQIGEEEVQRAMEEFAEPAMSGLVTVEAGGITLDFSPENSLHRFLAMEPVEGRLVDAYDLDALEDLYGSTWETVEINRADGTSTPVGPADVAGALREALRKTDPAERVGVIDLDPS